MNSKDNLNQLKQAVAKFPRGKWYSPDTTTKKENWFVSVAKGQAVGMPEVGDLVWVTKGRGGHQLFEVSKVEGEHTDKEGLARVTYTGKVIEEI